MLLWYTGTADELKELSTSDWLREQLGESRELISDEWKPYDNKLKKCLVIVEYKKLPEDIFHDVFEDAKDIGESKRYSLFSWFQSKHLNAE